MGIFFTSTQPVLPIISAAFQDALLKDPKTITRAVCRKRLPHRTIQLSQALSPAFNEWRFGGAVVIAGVLLFGAVYTGQHNLPDISKDLMNSFSGFSGLVLGLLGGEAQKSFSS